MEKQFSMLETVAKSERKQMWRDRVVAALFVVGMVVNIAVLDAQARTAMSPGKKVDHAVAVVDSAIAALPTT